MMCFLHIISHCFQRKKFISQHIKFFSVFSFLKKKKKKVPRAISEAFGSASGTNKVKGVSKKLMNQVID